MAEADPVKRLRAAAQRTAESASVEAQHRWYMNELEETIGRDPYGSVGGRRADPTRSVRLGSVLLVVTTLAIMFATSFAFLLWRDGTLSRFFDPAPAAPTQKIRGWVLADQETGRPSPVPTGKTPKSDAPPNEIEPLINPAATPEPVESEATVPPNE